MSRKIAIVQIEFYVDDDADYEEKTGRIMDYAEDNMGCAHCNCDWGTDLDSDTECEENCGNVCNLLGGSTRLMTEEQFDKEFLSDDD